LWLGCMIVWSKTINAHQWNARFPKFTLQLGYIVSLQEEAELVA